MRPILMARQAANLHADPMTKNVGFVDELPFRLNETCFTPSIVDAYFVGLAILRRQVRALSADLRATARTTVTVSNWMSRCGLVAMTVLASANVLAEASYPETIRLVRSMREDELIMAGQQAKLGADVKAGKAPRHAACLAQVKYPILTDAIAVVISSQLTDAEVAEGIQFYRSPLGQKILDRSYREITENLRPSTDYLTTEEKAALGKFAKRPVGHKLLKQRITRSDAIMDKVDVRMKVAYEDCDSAGGFATEGIAMPDSCRSAPVASPDNACSVEQTFYVYPPEAQVGTRTIV